MRDHTPDETNDTPAGEMMSRAAAYGWLPVPADPAGEGCAWPCLYHAEQDRIWPLDDPRGAIIDLGADPDEDPDNAAFIYCPAGFRADGTPDFQDQQSFWHDERDHRPAEGRGGVVWGSIAVAAALIAVLVIGAHALRAAELRPASCTNYPHECAAVLQEGRG